MAFPTTSVLDSFNRANEGPPPSANWTSQVRGSEGGIQVLSNEVYSAGAASSGWWNVEQFGPDCEVYATYASRGVGETWLWLRLQSPGSGAVDGYLLFTYNSSSNISISRVDNGAFTQLGANITGTSYATGDSIGFEAVGSTLSFYKKTGGSWGAAIDSRTDSTYSTGFIGLALEFIDPKMDDFGGGTVAVSSTAPTLLVMASPLRW